MPQSLAEIDAALARLGVSRAELERIQRTSPTIQQARDQLTALQAGAKQAYRRLALELHPDRTGGDEDKAAEFIRVTEVHQWLQSLQVKPAPVPVAVIRVWSGGAWTNAATTTVAW